MSDGIKVSEGVYGRPHITCSGPLPCEDEMLSDAEALLDINFVRRKMPCL